MGKQKSFAKIMTMMAAILPESEFNLSTLSNASSSGEGYTEWYKHCMRKKQRQKARKGGKKR